MKNRNLKCETCEVRGYNPDFCRWHKKRIVDVDIENCRPQSFYMKVGKTAVLGAGVGVVAVTAGLAAAPAVGLKAIIGHGLAVKLTAGSGAAGAGINLARGGKKNQPISERGKKRSVLLPLYLERED